MQKRSNHCEFAGVESLVAPGRTRAIGRRLLTRGWETGFGCVAKLAGWGVGLRSGFLPDEMRARAWLGDAEVRVKVKVPLAQTVVVVNNIIKVETESISLWRSEWQSSDVSRTMLVRSCQV